MKRFFLNIVGGFLLFFAVSFFEEKLLFGAVLFSIIGISSLVIANPNTFFTSMENLIRTFSSRWIKPVGMANLVALGFVWAYLVSDDPELMMFWLTFALLFVVSVFVRRVFRNGLENGYAHVTAVTCFIYSVLFFAWAEGQTGWEGLDVDILSLFVLPSQYTFFSLYLYYVFFGGRLEKSSIGQWPVLVFLSTVPFTAISWFFGASVIEAILLQNSPLLSLGFGFLLHCILNFSFIYILVRRIRSRSKNTDHASSV